MQRAKDWGLLHGSWAMRQLFFGNSPFFDAEIEAFETMRLEHLTELYRRHYRPDNMVVVVAGDIDLEQTERLVRKEFGKLGASQPRPMSPAAAEGRPRQAFEIHEFEHTRIAVGMKLPSRDDEAMLRALVVLDRYLLGNHTLTYDEETKTVIDRRDSNAALGTAIAARIPLIAVRGGFHDIEQLPPFAAVAPGYWYFEAELPDDQPPAAAERAILAALEDCLRNVDRSKLAASAQAVSAELNGYVREGSLHKLGTLFATHMLFGRDVGDLPQLPDGVMAISDAAFDAAKQWLLVPEHRKIAILLAD